VILLGRRFTPGGKCAYWSLPARSARADRERNRPADPDRPALTSRTDRADSACAAPRTVTGSATPSDRSRLAARSVSSIAVSGSATPRSISIAVSGSAAPATDSAAISRRCSAHPRADGYELAHRARRAQRYPRNPLDDPRQVFQRQSSAQHDPAGGVHDGRGGDCRPRAMPARNVLRRRRHRFH
jgi:hypothetical protein